MFQILVEESAEWPENGVLTVPDVYSGEITISPDLARRKANGYLTMYVAIFAYPKNPRLILNGIPIWEFDVWLRLRKVGDVGQLCTIRVNACTGEVNQFSEQAIEKIQECANELAGRAFSAANAGG